MVSISDFGIKYAALISASGLLFASMAIGATVDSSSLDLSVSGLRNAKGQVMVCLTANSKAFPDCSKDANAQKRMVAAAAAGNIRFTGIAPGTYAVSVVHDENGNGKLDTSIMIPKEGFGFSRNPTITFGPPTFKSASFLVGSADANQPVKMRYMF